MGHARKFHFKDIFLIELVYDYMDQNAFNFIKYKDYMDDF